MTIIYLLNVQWYTQIFGRMKYGVNEIICNIIIKHFTPVITKIVCNILYFYTIFKENIL